MPIFHYKARDKEGRTNEADRNAEDRYSLARELRGEGLTVLSVTEGATGGKKKTLDDYIPQFLKGVSLTEKLNFTRNSAVMIGAGLSLTKALEVMARQAHNKKFQAIILSMAETVSRGRTFADAVGEHPNIFPKFYQEMVRAGEKSGKLEEALKLVGMQLQKDYALRRKIRSAMMYPLIIMIAMVGIGILMLIYVVPTLISTFNDLHVALPASTRFIIFLSQSLVSSGLVFLGIVAVLGFLIFRWARSRTGKKTIDWAFVRTPVIGGINKKFNAARTCRTLSSLISSGVDIVEALGITREVLQNHLYKAVLDEARDRIQKGDPIAASFLAAEHLYPPLVGEMIAVGEETGELSMMLLRLAVFYENEVAVATKDLSTIIEPVLMIAIGAVVGFFAVSMISPMYSLVGAI